MHYSAFNHLTRPTFTLLLTLAMVLVSATANAQTEARIYQLNNRTAQSMAEQIRPLYPQEPVSLSARGTQLVVRAEPQLLNEIGQLIESMDVAPAQMRVTVRHREDIGGKQSGAGVSVSNNQVNARLKQKTITTHSARERHLVVQDGQSAHITSGRVSTLPVAIQGGRNPAAILEQVETRSGFIVSPQAISEQTIELTIVSFEEDPAALEGYETEALVTIRRVDPGQWVSLGGAGTSENSQQSGISYRVNDGRSANQSVEVKVDLLP